MSVSQFFSVDQVGIIHPAIQFANNNAPRNEERLDLLSNQLGGVPIDVLAKVRRPVRNAIVSATPFVLPIMRNALVYQQLMERHYATLAGITIAPVMVV